MSDDSPPSRTAMMAALARASHLLHLGPRALVADYYAWPLVGAEADSIIATARSLIGEIEIPFATWFGARARLTEDWLTQSGAERYVVLGAGLDSFAWRQAGGIRVFEVDRPSTQAWKRARTTELHMRQPDELTWVPVDFERDALRPALEEAGLDPGGPIFVSWLGVVPYLTREAILGTLRALPPCSLSVGYVPPNSDQDEDIRQLGAVMESVVGSLGEPWVTLTTPDQFAALLAEAGFTVVEDAGAHDIESRFGLPAMNYERMALARNDI